jgi:hypothetical protein
MKPACNTFISALAMAGEVDKVKGIMWELARAGRVVDDITRQAVVEELMKAEKREDADRVVRELEEKGIVSPHEGQALLSSIHDDHDNNLDVDDHCPREGQLVVTVLESNKGNSKRKVDRAPLRRECAAPSRLGLGGRRRSKKEAAAEHRGCADGVWQ